MRTLLADLRYGLRMLAKTPAVTLVAVITLALGVGANTAIFTAAYATLARSLPFDEPERLVKIATTKQGNLRDVQTAYPNFRDWKSRNKLFESMSGYALRGAALAGDERPEMVEAPVVSADLFRALGVNAAVGRTFAPNDDEPAAARTVVLTYGFWQKRFGGRPEIIGQKVALDNEPHTVIGVLPANFQFAPLGAVQVFQPPPAKGSMVTRRNLHWFNVIGRLKPGVSIQQAQSEMEAISKELQTEYPAANADIDVTVAPLREAVVGEVRPIVTVLLAAVGFVLLICCANVANLQLARSEARRKEIAVRVALGASRRRIFRQVLTESVLLGLIGGAAGIAVAMWTMTLLIAGIPPAILKFMPYLQSLGVDQRALLFTGAVSLAAGVLFGVAPAWQLSSGYAQALKDTTRTSGTRTAHRLRDVIVAAEIAVSAMLLIGAGLLGKSLYRMLRVDPGFNRHNLLVVQAALPSPKYSGTESLLAAWRELQGRIARLPGVVGVAHTNRLPLDGGWITIRFRVEGRPAQSAGEQPEANIRAVSENLFSVLGATLIKGRYFNENDTEKSPRVVIINRALAQQLFAGDEPVGKRLTFTYAPDQPWREIVGVINNVNEHALDAEARPALYLPFAQGAGNYFNVVVRTGAGEPQALAAAVRREIESFDGQIAVLEFSTMDRRVAESQPTFLRRYPATLTAAFAAVAVLLAMIGVYGVIAYSVTQRTHEIGVRIALGAQRRDVLRLMMSKGLRLLLAGVAAGVIGGIVVSRLIAGMLFGLRSTDVGTFALTLAAISATALLASYIPARRATRVDPMVALRYE